MFDELVVSTKEKKKTNRAALAISTTFQILVIGAAILYPLLVTDVLPAKAMLSTLLVAPPPPAPAPPPPPTEVVHVKPQVHLIQAGKLVAPRAIPKEVKIIKEEPEPDISGIGVAGGVPGGMPGGQAGGVIGGILGGMPSAAPPPPKATPTRIKQGGNVQQAMLIVHPTPAYPALARQARIQGTVVLHAIIAKDGSVQQLEVISGHPLLVQAALDAVKQWRYKPTLLNTEPVEVDTTISVVFSMGG